MKLKIGWALAAGALLMNIGWNPAGSPRWSLLGGAAARAQVSVDFGFFHDELAPYGDWRQREPYGWVWFPDVGRSWRPYTFGYWVFTADYGWTWISTDPWGSIPFHYGRWFYDEGRRAWAWVPGTEWGPAWVGWRSGGGYIGWAPLPPSVEFDATVDFAPADRDFGSRWNSWSFVPTGRFVNQGLERFIVPRPRNVALINTTVNVTHYSMINRRIVNRSIDPDRYEEEARTRLVRYQVDEISRPVRRERPVRGGRVVLFKPQVVRTELAPSPSIEQPRRFGVSPEGRAERREPGADRPLRKGPGSAGDERTGQRPGRPMTDDQRQQSERERARQWAEREQRQQADPDSTRQRTEQERAQRQAEREQARQQAIQQRQQTEREQARQLTEQERAQRQAERETQRQAEQARRQAERDQARQQQSEQERAQRQAEREQARQQAIQQRQQAEQEQLRQRTEQERAQRQAEREQARQQASQQRQQAEQEQLRQRTEQERAQRQAEREAQRQAEQAQRQAERQAQRQAERDAQRQAEQAQRQAEREQARQQAIQQRQQQQQQGQQEQQRRRNLPECKSLPPGVQQECR